MTKNVTIISIRSKQGDPISRQTGRDTNFVYEVSARGGNIEEVLNDAFYFTSTAADRPLAGRCSATGPGDILVVDGAAWLIETYHRKFHRYRFMPLSAEQREAIERLTSDDTSLGLKWMIENRGVPVLANV